MDTHKHTPAPWIMANHNFVYALNDQKSNRFCLSVIGGHELLTSSTSIRTSYEEIAANAALICAAPDLLEAAQQAMQVFINQGWDDDLIEAKTLKAAIGKATSQNQPQ